MVLVDGLPMLTADVDIKWKASMENMERIGVKVLPLPCMEHLH